MMLPIYETVSQNLTISSPWTSAVMCTCYSPAPGFYLNGISLGKPSQTTIFKMANRNAHAFTITAAPFLAVFTLQFISPSGALCFCLYVLLEFEF